MANPKPRRQTTLLSQDGKRLYRLELHYLNPNCFVLTRWVGLISTPQKFIDYVYGDIQANKTARAMATKRYTAIINNLRSKGYKSASKATLQQITPPWK